MIATEACTGFDSTLSPPKRGVDLGNWERGQQYLEDVIGDLRHGVISWTDWNMVLDMNGGPNHVNNTCDAPIVIDFDNKVFYKQPMYYMLGHITRYIRPGMRSILINENIIMTRKIWITAAIDNAKNTVIVLYNSDKHNAYNVTINDDRIGHFSLEIPSDSVHTIIYNLN